MLHALATCSCEVPHNVRRSHNVSTLSHSVPNIKCCICKEIHKRITPKVWISQRIYILKYAHTVLTVGINTVMIYYELIGLNCYELISEIHTRHFCYYINYLLCPCHTKTPRSCWKHVVNKENPRAWPTLRYQLTHIPETSHINASKPRDDK